jgi:hypothetical protein
MMASLLFWLSSLLLPCLYLIPRGIEASSTTDASSMSSSSSSSLQFLEDLRQLDSYGESVALRHATAAADRHGRTVVVLYHPNDDCWYICTPMMIITGSISSSSSSSMTKTKKNKKPANGDDVVSSSSPAAPFLLQTIQRGDTAAGPRNGSTAAGYSSCSLLVATGIAGDAKYFVSELQTYVARIRHEFGTTLVPHWEQRLVPFLLRRCFNYDESQAFNLPVLDEYNEQQQGQQQQQKKKFPYSRPLGLRAVLFRYTDAKNDNNSNNNDTNAAGWSAWSMDPSGTLLSITKKKKEKDDGCCSCFVMGRDAKSTQERLKSRYRHPAGDEEKLTLSSAAFIETTLRTAFDDGRPLQLEILRPDGSLERRTIAASD